MKGKILDYSIQNSSWLISGENGERYEFYNSEWKSDKAPKINQKVDFEADDKIAKSIYLEPVNLEFDADSLKSKISNVTDSDIVKNSPLSWYFTVLKKYVDFDGRAQRSEYWFFMLFYTIGLIILSVIDAVIGMYSVEAGIGLLSGIFVLANILPSISVGVRRMHDIGKSGWWLLINIIPLIGPIVFIVFAATDSKEDNQYGTNPKAVA